MAFEDDPEHVEDLPFHCFGARMHVEERRHRRIVFGHLNADPHTSAIAHAQQAHDDLESLGIDLGRKPPRRLVAEIVDSRHVDAHVEGVLVPQVHHEVGELLACHVQDRLAA